MSSKRDRATNWDKEEKHLLREVVRPFLSIIENKDLSTNTNKAKLNAWAEIVENFNTANIIVREKKQIISQWKTLKLSSKKQYFQYKKDVSKTGGGPKPPSPSPDIMEVVEMLPQEFEVDTNEFDVDGFKDLTKEILTETKQETEDGNNNYKYIQSDDTQGEDTQGEVSQSSYIGTTPTPKRSAKKKKTQKQSNSSNFSKATFNDMHHYRVLENERLQKEHELRLKNMADLHSQVMRNLKLQEEYLKQMISANNK